MFFLFDIDDTLYDLEIPFRVAFKDMFKYEPKDLHEIFLDFRKYNNLIYEKALVGEITMDEMCIYRAKEAFKDHGIIIDDEEAMKFQMIYLRDKNCITLDPYIEKTLKLLNEKNIPIGIVSNGPHSDQLEKVGFLDLYRYVKLENIFISEDIGAFKPEAKIFNYAREKMGISDSDVAYFTGDSFELDILGSSNTGFKTIWVNRRNYREEYDLYRPDFTAYTFKEVYDIIENLIR